MLIFLGCISLYVICYCRMNKQLQPAAWRFNVVFVEHCFGVVVIREISTITINKDEIERGLQIATIITIVEDVVNAEDVN